MGQALTGCPFHGIPGKLSTGPCSVLATLLWLCLDTEWVCTLWLLIS